MDEAIKVFGLTPKQPLAVDVSGMGLPSELTATNGSCQTLKVRLVGAHGYSEDLPSQLVEKYGIDQEVAESLASSYGDRAWQVTSLTQGANGASHQKLSANFPFLECEVRFAVQNEYAQTAADFLGRRTRMSFLDSRSALEALPRVIDLMAVELEWDSTRQALEWRESVRYLVSMGLPKDMVYLSREEVVDGKYSKELERERPLITGVSGTTMKEPGFTGVAAHVSA